MPRTLSWCVVLPLLLVACHRDGPAGKPGDAPAKKPDAGALASADAGPATAQLLEEGAEPRAVLTYAFDPGRQEARVLTIDSLIEGKTTLEDQVELRFKVRYPAADTVELVLRSAHTTEGEIKDIESTQGTRVVQRIRKDGTTDAPEVVSPKGADGTAAEYVKGAILQIAGTLVVPLPEKPIGVGARWRFGDDSPTLRLVSREKGALVFERTLEIHGMRNVERGKAVKVDEEQSTRVEATLDGIVKHVESKLVTGKVIGKMVGAKRTTHLRFDVCDPL